VIPASFDYVRPTTIHALFDALADPDARIIAGGHSLLPLMKLRIVRPTTLVDIAAVGLSHVTEDGDALRIGALATYADLLDLDPRMGLPDVLRECAASVGDLQVRNAGTVGGALAHGDPASDLAAGALAVCARVRLLSPEGERTVDLRDFFLGPYSTALAAQELLTEIVIPRRTPGEGSVYVAFDDSASGYPLVGVAVQVATADGAASVGLCGIGGRPVHATSAAAALAAFADLDDDYRAHLGSVAVDRALALARRRAERSAR
jgi:aerobic carbon-monoxide dehydrogenase medium subunit